ncbi:MAG: hypothetical protein J1E37_02320 [Prevotella sp.]|nr:hypothetical protein [Prevotella sp.]
MKYCIYGLIAFLLSVYTSCSSNSVPKNSDSEDAEVSSAFSSNSEDWDDILDSYEQYVDKYILYVKKIAEGDVTAMEEYPILLEKAQEFSEKISSSKSDMTTSQWTRYMKITNKMLGTAKEIEHN